MRKNPLRNYGEMLKGFRLDTYKTQAEIAKSLGVSVMTVSNWESGRTLPSKEAREALKVIYSMPPEATVFNSLDMYSKEELKEMLYDLLEKTARWR